MTIYSGTGGNVKVGGSDVLEVRRWVVTEKGNTKAYNTSDTGGVIGRQAGPVDWEATVSVYTDDTTHHSTQLRVNTAVAVQFHFDSGDYWSANGIVDEVTETADIEGGELDGAEIRLMGNGALSLTKA